MNYRVKIDENALMKALRKRDKTIVYPCDVDYFTYSSKDYFERCVHSGYLSKPHREILAKHYGIGIGEYIAYPIELNETDTSWCYNQALFFTDDELAYLNDFIYFKDGKMYNKDLSCPKAKLRDKYVPFFKGEDLPYEDLPYEYENDEQEEILDWNYPRKTYRRFESKRNVMVSVSNETAKKKVVVITFFADLFKLTLDNRYIYALKNDSIFLKEFSNGFKVSKLTEKSCALRISVEDTNKFAKFVGTYKISCPINEEIIEIKTGDLINE